MTKLPLVFDTDCLSSFLWVKRTDIIKQLFPGQIIVPSIVTNELSRVRHLFDMVDAEASSGHFSIYDIQLATAAFTEYLELTSMKNPMRIGGGEAAAIAIARELDGTVASNNLSDIFPYVKDEKPPYLCTDNILFMAYEAGLITDVQGNSIWNEMKRRRRQLPDYDFSEAIRRFHAGLPRG
jgi:hypothetical protein